MTETELVNRIKELEELRIDLIHYSPARNYRADRLDLYLYRHCSNHWMDSCTHSTYTLSGMYLNTLMPFYSRHKPYTSFVLSFLLFHHILIA